MHHLVGPHEIGLMLGVGRQRVYQLVSRPDFPEPEVRLVACTVWSTADVMAWAKSKGRAIHE